MDVEIYPTAHDLLAVCAILWQENEGLRERSGVSGLSVTKRLFTSDDLERGREIGLSTFVTKTGSVVIQAES